MVIGREEYKLRKDRILGITVKEYVRSVTPVSSKLISMEYPLDLSSATIRNILAELEQEGLLCHPHTSAGRIPTELGYRYYVDNLMHEIQLLEEEKNQIQTEYRRAHLELESLLERTSRLISETTQYTGIISVDGERKIICTGTNYVVQYPDQADLQKIHDILAALEEKERLYEFLSQELEKKVNVYIGHEIALAEMDSCSLVVSPYRTKRGATGRLAVLGPTRMNYEKVVSSLEYLSQLMEEF